MSDNDSNPLSTDGTENPFTRKKLNPIETTIGFGLRHLQTVLSGLAVTSGSAKEQADVARMELDVAARLKKLRDKGDGGNFGEWQKAQPQAQPQGHASDPNVIDIEAREIPDPRPPRSRF